MADVLAAYAGEREHSPEKAERRWKIEGNGPLARKAAQRNGRLRMAEGRGRGEKKEQKEREREG